MSRIDEIREREAKATNGPWIVRGGQSESNPPFVEQLHPEPGFGTICVHGGQLFWYSPARENADFIAHSREDIPYLLWRLGVAETRLKNVLDSEDWAAYVQEYDK